jgi:hypothetical protein
MNVHVVDSKQHMLVPNDIFIVAAHEYKDGLEKTKAPAKKYGMSPERLQYTIMVKMFQEPSLIRVREGNTFFAIKAMPKRTGFVFSWNADIATNYVNNMVEFFHAARKMGFDVLIAQAHTPEMVRLLKLAAKRVKMPNVKSKYDSKSQFFVMTTGEKRE